MATAPSSSSVLTQLRTLFCEGTAAGLTDAQLLDRINAARETAGAAEQAFAVLVARHGPMVLGVCRRLLHDPHEVEDAFQATFLVLVRKSGSVRVDDSLGRWLYGVARRVAGRARGMSSRRQAGEGRPASGEPATEPTDDVRAELLAALDDELGRLPAKYRAPVWLCYFEGLSHAEAAHRLRWPLGTVKGRLAQARSLLRARLVRRGLAPALVVLDTALEAQARLAVPEALAHAAVRSAARFASGAAAGAGSVPAAVLALTRGTLRSMILVQLRTAALCVLAALPLTAGAAALAGARDPGDDPRPASVSARDEPGPGREEARALGSGRRRRVRGVPVVSEVHATSRVTFLVADGRLVNRGDLLFELDPAALKDQWTNQKIAAEGAKAAYQNARLTREVAEIAVKEYVEGVFKSELQAILGEIGRSEAERKRAEDRLKWSEKMHEKGFVPEAQLNADRLSVAQKTLIYEQAQTKKNLLEKFTRDKTIKTLRSDVEKARSDELAKLQNWELEKARLAGIERDIAACRIVAPISGRLVHARVRDDEHGGRRVPLALGSTVVFQQLLARVVPTVDAR